MQWRIPFRRSRSHDQSALYCRWATSHCIVSRALAASKCFSPCTAISIDTSRKMLTQSVRGRAKPCKAAPPDDCLARKHTPVWII